MTSDSADVTLPPAASNRSLLIPLGDRRRFVVLYVIATLVAWQIARYFWSFLLDNTALDGMVQNMAQSFLTGATVGFGQWWVLRRYIPTWQWIAANTLGQMAIALGNELWLHHLRTLAQQDPNNFLETFGNNYAMPLPLTVLASLPMVILQWLVLRRYLQTAYAWFLVPVVVSGVSILFFILTGLLGLANLPIRFALPILIPGIGGTVQAIALCLFRSKRGVPLSDLEEGEISPGNRAIQPLLLLALITLLGVATLAIGVGSLGIAIERIQMG